MLPDGEATLDAAVAYGHLLAATTGPHAVEHAKRQLYEDVLRGDPAASVAESKELLDVAMGTDEYREGISAFLQRRPPKF